MFTGLLNILQIHWQYGLYVAKHRWFVFLECCKLGIPLRGLTHDLSKFSPAEWFCYANYFYGHDANEYNFNAGWLHHQHRNDHHWQHWVLREDEGGEVLMAMRLGALKEMVADWRGVSRTLTGKDDAVSWYLKHKDIIRLHPYSRAHVEGLLGLTDT